MIPTEPTPRLARAVSILDRLFPIAWIGLYLLLPVSGWAPVMFDSWFDQMRDLEALRSVLAEGHADAIDTNGIGPAYIAAAALVHWILGLDARDSLVALTRASYALSIAAGLVVVRVAVTRLSSAPPLVSLSTQVLFVSFAFAAGTWHWSDVPWSHFFAAFLAVALYAIRYAPVRVGLAQAGAVGAVCALLALTRSFEFAALVLAWALALLLLWALRLLRSRSWRAGNLLAFLGGAFAATIVVYGVTGKRDVFFLYSSALDQQSGDVSAAEVATTPTFDFGAIPVKLVQLFVEPCYYAMCSLANYAGGSSALPPELHGAAGNERLWRLPLALQLPALALLPLCIVGVAVLLFWFVRNRAAASERTRELRLLVELTIASTGIVVGYLASTMTGSPHLRNGFARDFLLPAALTAVVAASLTGIGLWHLASRLTRDRRWSPAAAVVVPLVIVAMAFVGVSTYARAHGLPRLERLGPVSFVARCHDGACSVRVRARTRAGRPISIPEASTLTFGCGSDRARFSVYASHLSEPVKLGRSCRNPRLVAAWPTIMGLPPGSFELWAVRVRNVAS